MAKTIEQLKTQSAEVKNATVVGENTATRVGTLFNDIVEHIEQVTADGATTTKKLAPLAVTTEKLADGTVTTKKLADSVKQAIIYDVSALNGGVAFESISALLSNSNLDTLIPESFRHGGICIRFIQGSVQNSDNKYVQYRLMANDWSTVVTDWQGVDDEPTAGSNNLVNSGGVFSKIASSAEFTKENCSIVGIICKNGVINTSYGETYKTSDYIPLKWVTTVEYENLFPEASGADDPCGLVIFDSNKQVTRYKGDGTGTFIPENGETYVRFSVRVAQNDESVTLNYNNEITQLKQRVTINENNINTLHQEDIEQELNIDNIKDTLNLRIPFLRLNGTTSLLSYANKESIATNDGTLKLLVKLPYDISQNNIMVAVEASLMIGYNGNYLAFYNYSRLVLGLDISSYAGKVTLFEFEKTNGILKVSINGVLLVTKSYTPDPTGTDNTIYIGSIWSGELKSLIDFYYLQMFDTNGNLSWEINSYTEPNDFEDVNIYIADRNIAEVSGDFGNSETKSISQKKFTEEISDIRNIITDLSTYDTSDCTIKGILLKNGSVSTNWGDTYYTSDYISISKVKKVSYENLFPEASGADDPCGLVVYNASKQFVRYYGNGTGEFQVISGDAYIRFTPLRRLENNAKVDVSYKLEETHYLDSLPSKIYLTQNKQYNIYMDNVVIGYSEMGLMLNVDSSVSNIRKIEAMGECVRLNIPTTGTFATIWNLYDANGKLLESKNISLVVTSPTSGSGTKQFLFIGDSTIDNAVTPEVTGGAGPNIVKEFYNLCVNNEGFTPLLLGKRTYVEGGITYRHEGYAGMSSSYFLSTSGTYISPFCYNGVIDFAAYMADIVPQITGATNTIDYVFYQIGINDLKGSGSISALISNIKNLIDFILIDYPSAKIIIGMPPTGNDAQGWSNSFNGSITTLREYIPFRNRMMEYLKLIITEFDNSEYSENVYISNAGQMIDRKYGFPFEMQHASDRVSVDVFRHIDSVHPNVSGYKQIADGYFGRIKSLV